MAVMDRPMFRQANQATNIQMPPPQTVVAPELGTPEADRLLGMMQSGRIAPSRTAGLPEVKPLYESGILSDSAVNVAEQRAGIKQRIGKNIQKADLTPKEEEKVVQQLSTIDELPSEMLLDFGSSMMQCDSPRLSDCLGAATDAARSGKSSREKAQLDRRLTEAKIKAEEAKLGKTDEIKLSNYMVDGKPIALTDAEASKMKDSGKSVYQIGDVSQDQGKEVKLDNYIVDGEVKAMTAEDAHKRIKSGDTVQLTDNIPQKDDKKAYQQIMYYNPETQKMTPGRFDPSAEKDNYTDVQGNPIPDGVSVMKISAEGKMEDMGILTKSQQGDVAQQIVSGDLIVQKLQDIRSGIVSNPEAAGYLGGAIEVMQGIAEQLDVAIGTNAREFVPGGQVTRIRGQIKQLRPMMISYLRNIGRYNQTTEKMIDNLVSVAESSTGPKQALIQIDNMMEQLSRETKAYNDKLLNPQGAEPAPVTEEEFNNLQSGETFYIIENGKLTKKVKK